MDLDDGGVEHDVLHVRLLRAGLEKPLEDIRLHPIAISLEDGVPVPESGRQITPGASRSHDPQDRFDEASVVAAAASGVRRLAQTMRFHLRPLGVRQYISFHPKLESHPSHGGNQEASVRSGGSGAEGLRDRDLIEAGLSEPAGWRAGYGDCGCAAWSETAMGRSGPVR